MRHQHYEQPSHEHAIRSMLLRSGRSQGGLYLPGGPVLARRRLPGVIPGLPLWTAGALVQAKSDTASGTTCNVTFNTTPTAGNVIWVVARSNDEPFAATAITDNKGNTYTVTRHLNGGSGSLNAVFAYAFNITASATFTVTVTTAGGTDLELGISEWSGIATTSPHDSPASVGRTDSGTTSLKSTGNASNATTQADSIVICGAVDHGSGTETFSGSGPYVLALDGDRVGITYNVLSATGIQDGLIDIGHTFGTADVRADVFKAAGGGGGAVKRDNLLLMGVGR